MRVVDVVSGCLQDWGVQIENKATLLRVNAEKYVTDWPDGTPQAVFSRADGYTYNVPCKLDGKYVLIELTKTETWVAGTSKVEVTWIEGDSVVKSDTYFGKINKTISDKTGDRPPEPMTGYVEQMMQLGAEVAEAAERVEDAMGLQPIIGENGNWQIYNPDTGEYEDSGTPSNGGGDAVEF